MTETAGAPVGILLINLGTPQAPTASAVRRWLREFLSDRRVIGLSPILWQPILHGVILRTRPQKTARLYQSIWRPDGSPLLAYSQRLCRALQREMAGDGQRVRTALGMRYGKPSIVSALQQLKGCTELIVLPLYPQYADSTTASAWDAVQKALTDHTTASVQFISDYAEHAGYIEACAACIHQARRPSAADRLLLSFHGLPKSVVDAGDPYFRRCHATATRIAQALDLRWDQWGIAFQSRFGPREWLTPYTEATLTQWAKLGVPSVEVFCPGFATDCLETLEEIQIRARDAFLQAGGRTFRYLPALNDRPEHIQALASLIEKHRH